MTCGRRGPVGRWLDARDRSRRRGPSEQGRGQRGRPTAGAETSRGSSLRRRGDLLPSRDSDAARGVADRGCAADADQRHAATPRFDAIAAAPRARVLAAIYERVGRDREREPLSGGGQYRVLVDELRFDVDPLGSDAPRDDACTHVWRAPRRRGGGAEQKPHYASLRGVSKKKCQRLEAHAHARRARKNVVSRVWRPRSSGKIGQKVYSRPACLRSPSRGQGRPETRRPSPRAAVRAADARTARGAAPQPQLSGTGTAPRRPARPRPRGGAAATMPGQASKSTHGLTVKFTGVENKTEPPEGGKTYRRPRGTCLLDARRCYVLQEDGTSSPTLPKPAETALVRPQVQRLSPRGHKRGHHLDRREALLGLPFFREAARAQYVPSPRGRSSAPPSGAGTRRRRGLRRGYSLETDRVREQIRHGDGVPRRQSAETTRRGPQREREKNPTRRGIRAVRVGPRGRNGRGHGRERGERRRLRR